MPKRKIQNSSTSSNYTFPNLEINARELYSNDNLTTVAQVNTTLVRTLCTNNDRCEMYNFERFYIAYNIKQLYNIK